ncbi:MAG: hypothetical protein NXH85_00985 [Pseudomonadaceae bacterium]|nr:hypothetical protein [Pseudomonadaceae bacterium]
MLLRTFFKLLVSVSLLALVMGCNSADVDAAPDKQAIDSARLTGILAAQPEETQARYQYRNPQATLEYFGVEPGMTVVEALPGGGWYSKVLLPYLGQDGELIGVNYPLDLWPNFPFGTEEFVARMATWSTDWSNGAQEWRGDDGAEVSAFVFGSMPEQAAGTADAVLFIRALHNLARFSDKRDFLGEALGTAYSALKPGGIVGVVQHQAPESMTDEWANGSRGYLKKSFVIAQMEAAGFEYLGSTNINANPKDNPGADDIVWRLPPSLRVEDDAQKTANLAIGESNRMTLKFRKPV